MPTYNEIESAWGPNEDEINTVAESALLLKVVGKIPAQPEPPPSTVLFHPELVDRDFGSHLLSVAKLIEWADQQGLEVATLPPLDQFQFVQVEALLCAIERAAIGTTTEAMAVAIVQATPRLAHDEAAEIAPRWLIAADAHKQWRHLIAHAVAMHELVLLHFGSKLPVQPRNDAESQFKPSSLEPEWALQARKRAIEIIERQRKKDLYPSQIAIADEIAREFRGSGVAGLGGKPLAGAYIKRHALKGISSEKNKKLKTTINRGK